MIEVAFLKPPPMEAVLKVDAVSHKVASRGETA